MKFSFILLLVIFSLNAFACPDLSGSYVDKSGESVILVQKNCDEVSILSRPLTHTLLLNNEFTVVQDDLDVLALGRGAFQLEELVLEVKVTYKKDPGIPGMLLPVRAVNKYTQTSNGDLYEKSSIYNAKDSVLLNTKTTYKKINQ